MSDEDRLQELCAAGQRLLALTDYLGAQRMLAEAQAIAWQLSDWDTLARLYMPLQEARRQCRQRCGEGVVKLDVMATSPTQHLNAEQIVEQFPHGQLLVAGWGTIEPSLRVRRLAAERGLYVETFLAAAYPVGGSARDRSSRHVIVIVPTAGVSLPAAEGLPIDALHRGLPPHSLIIPDSGIPAGQQRGNDQTFARTMALWEQLHRPFLAAADATSDPVRRMIEYKRTIEVDYAAELPHQKLARLAAQMACEVRRQSVAVGS